MITQLFATIMYAIIVTMISLAANYIFFKHEQKTISLLPHIIVFANSVILTSVFLYFIPQAADFSSDAFIMCVFGFLTYYILEEFVLVNFSAYDKENINITFPGLLLQTTIFGAMIAIGFEVSYTFGLISTTIIALYKIPEAMKTMHIFFENKVDMKNIFLALLTVIIAIASYFFVRDITLNSLGKLVAASAGILLYCSARNLLTSNATKSSSLLMVVGVLSAILIGNLF